MATEQAGVVMVDGSDYVTLENCAVTAGTSRYMAPTHGRSTT